MMGFLLEGIMDKISIDLCDRHPAWKKDAELQNIPIDEFVKLIKFEDGVAEFDMVALYRTSSVYSSDMFLAIQRRQSELNNCGYRTFSIENNGYYQMSRTWYVWSKEKTLERKKLKELVLLTLRIAGAVLFLFLLYWLLF